MKFTRNVTTTFPRRRRRIAYRYVWIVAASTILFAGCGQNTTPAPNPSERSAPPSVYAVSYPLAYFARRIGGELVDVTFPIPPDVDPAIWDPDANSIAAFQSADLVLLNGADYAKWTLRASLPWSRTVVTTRDIKGELIEVPDAVTHTHGPDGEHSHAALASETWLDPRLAVAQARTIKEEFQKLLPDSTDSIQARFDLLAADLLSLDKDFESVFAPKSNSWVASHMGFSYLARRYSVNMPIAHVEPDLFPSEKQWRRLAELIDGRTSTWMLWPKDPIEKTRDRLNEMNIEIIVFHTADRPPESGDYLTVMRENLQRIRRAASSQQSQR